MRPRKRRRIRGGPRCQCFKPQGIPLRNLPEVGLAHDELEALRLADFRKMDQVEAAKRMEISQSTFQRILASARRKTSEALIEGKTIRFNETDN